MFTGNILSMMSDITFQQKIGHGATGEIYSGYWRGTKVALKKFHNIFLNLDPVEKERLFSALAHEIELWNSLKHPNLLPLLGYCEDLEYGFIEIMPLMKCSLFDYIRNKNFPPLSFRVIVDILRGVLSAIVFYLFLFFSFLGLFAHSSRSDYSSRYLLSKCTSR